MLKHRPQMPAMTWAIVIVANVFGSWALFFPVTPLLVSAVGGSRFAAGATTGIFMATTILAQLATPMLLRRYDFRPVIAGGCLILGLPCLGLIPWSENITALMVISAVRGVGFGLVTVSCSALPPHLARGDGLGRAVAAQGMANAGTQTVCLLIGLQLYHAGGTVAVVLPATAMSVIAATAVIGIPRSLYGILDTNRGPDTQRHFANAPIALACLSVLGAAAAYGGLSALLPLVDYPQAEHAGMILATIGGTVVVGRFAAGRLASRIREHRAFAEVGAIVGIAGMVSFFAAVASGGAAFPLTVMGAMAFGFGLGWVQNVTLVQAFNSVPAHRVGFASAAWNISMDAGIGAGSTMMGAIADRSGFAGAHLASAAVLAVIVLLPVLARAAGGRWPGQRDSIDSPLQDCSDGLRSASDLGAEMSGEAVTRPCPR